jgi:hypothetical protein
MKVRTPVCGTDAFGSKYQAGAFGKLTLCFSRNASKRFPETEGGTSKGVAFMARLLMRPVEFGEAVPAGTRLPLFSGSKSVDFILKAKSSESI